jgi:hypothetical protein
MGILRSRVRWEQGEARLVASNTAVGEVIGRIATTGSAAAVIRDSSLSSGDVVAAVASAALGDDQSLGPALAQSSPKLPRLLPALKESAWAALFPASTQSARLNLAAGLLLMQDFWDESHNAAQQADDIGEREFSAYWHGIAHRREPDAGNAGYWFRRVGRHPVFVSLGEEARPLLDANGDEQLTRRLTSSGWDPFAMIDLCTQAATNTPRETLARRLQRLEMWLLLEATVGALAQTGAV